MGIRPKIIYVILSNQKKNHFDHFVVRVDYSSAREQNRKFVSTIFSSPEPKAPGELIV